MNLSNDRVTLNNETSIPMMGLGVYQVSEDDTAQVVATAIKNGYRLIDTAQIYGNEKETGEGIKRGLAENNLKREDLFVTSKIWNAHISYGEALEAYEDSLQKLGLDYLDLYLIHWPGDNAFKDAWLALESLYEQKKIKAIGVSNFQIHHLEELKEYAKVTPVINQIELHPMLSQTELRQYHADHNIKTQAWSPLMQGQILKNEVINEIAERYNKTAAQIVLRWDIQQGILLNVKSIRIERMISNAQIFDFELLEDDMTKINALNQDQRVGPSPDEFDF